MLADENDNEAKIFSLFVSEYQKAADSETGEEFDNPCTTEAILGVFYWFNGQWQEPV